LGGATSNPSEMSQAVSPGDTEWKTLNRVEISIDYCVLLATGEPALAFEETDTAGGAELEGNQG
jgi:hypothetical protein